MSPETAVPSGLETYRHPVYPFLYVVEDEKACRDILNLYTGVPHGLEVGFGDEPTRTFRLNSTLPWLLTEPDARWFDMFRHHLSDYWSDMSQLPMKNIGPQIALRTYASVEDQHAADHVVYRNPDYRDMYMIPYAELCSGQRISFIVNNMHVDELTYYRQFLYRHGYNPDMLSLRDPLLPTISYPYGYAPEEYIFDLTKETS